MTQVSRNSKTSLPTITSKNKFFYLTNNEYYSYSSYIYICLEDSNFGLINSKINYCQTSINPGSHPDIVVNNCSFKLISYHRYQSYSSKGKYCYKIPTSNSYTYSIVYYEGSHSSGSLYITGDYNDLSKSIKMTQVNRNSKTSLPATNSENKYFYLTNS